MKFGRWYLVVFLSLPCTASQFFGSNTTFTSHWVFHTPLPKHSHSTKCMIVVLTSKPRLRFSYFFMHQTQIICFCVCHVPNLFLIECRKSACAERALPSVHFGTLIQNGVITCWGFVRSGLSTGRATPGWMTHYPYTSPILSSPSTSSCYHHCRTPCGHGCPSGHSCASDPTLRRYSSSFFRLISHVPTLTRLLN